MAGFLAVLLVGILILALTIIVVLGLGIGISYALRSIWPGIDLGTGILIGVVAAGVSLHYFFRVLNFLELLPRPVDPSLLQSDEDEDEDEDDEPPVVYVRPQMPLPRRRRRRR